jgi:alpha-glucosidase
MQRFGAAVWTGDIAGDWPTLQRTPGELLSFGLSGMPYSTCDIGGFYGKAPAELVVRWIEAGVFFPLMRAHSTRGDMPHFPWLYGAAAEDAIRQALDLRYRLIPYYYSLAHETAETGEPIMRPLVMEFPDDPAVAGITDEWLMGRGLLAAPVLNAGGKRTVRLPKDTWYRLGSGERIAGATDVSVNAKLEEIPVYVRAGTILPLGPVVQYTGQATQEPLEVQVYPGRDAAFTLVEDDGATTAYESGAVRKTTFTWNEQNQKLSWKVTGPYAGDNVFKAMKVVLFSTSGLAAQTGVLGRDDEMDFSSRELKRQ